MKKNQLRTNRIRILFSLTALLLFPFISKAQITVDVNGKVGVGTSTPVAKLHLSGGDPNATFINATIALGYSTTGQYPHFIHTRHVGGVTAGNAIDFYTGDGTANGVYPTNAILGMSIVNGNVGIGTTNPSYPFDVAGVIRSFDNSFNTINAKLDGTSSPNLSFTRWTGSGTNQYNAKLAQVYNSTTSTYDLGFYTGYSTSGNQTTNTLNMVVAYGGNVGIGTTNPNDKLDVVGNVNLNSGTNAFKIGGNKVLWNNNNVDNIFVGVGAGAITTGSYNTFTGPYSGNSNTTSAGNSAFGYAALVLNTSGSGFNSAFGYAAIYTNTTGSNNSAFGGAALYANTTGNYNTALGYIAGSTNTSGTNNTLIGYAANVSTGALTNATAIGNGATVTASNNMVFGNNNLVGWGFGVAPTSGKAILVGSTASNGYGAYLTTGGVWTNGSSRTYKDNITSLDGADILKKISQLEVTRWKYKETNEYHIGPFAEQFYELFNTGIDNMHISTVDPSGIALIGIKQLIKQNAKMEQMLEGLDSTIKALNSKSADLQNQIANCCAKNHPDMGILNNPNNIGNENGNIINDISSATTATLFQNIPNPFNQQTSIQYFIPTNAHNASIMVFDLNGKLMSTLPVTSFGKGAITINGNELNPGMFVYSLVVDGKIIDTKRMILTH